MVYDGHNGKKLLEIYFIYFMYHLKNVQTDHNNIEKAIHRFGSVRLPRLRLKLFRLSLNIYYGPGKKYVLLISFQDQVSKHQTV